MSVLGKDKFCVQNDSLDCVIRKCLMLKIGMSGSSVTTLVAEKNLDYGLGFLPPSCLEGLPQFQALP